MQNPGGRSLSDLSDDLLQHILSFATTSDRATTAVLSQRWLRLWRTSGDVYLNSCSFNDDDEAFLCGAEKALAAATATAPIRRLTISISQHSKITLLKQSWSSSEKKLITEHNLLEALVSNPAARRVEELQIEVKPLNTRSMLSFGSLPSQALRVLRIIIRCLVVVVPAPPPPPPPGIAATAAALTFPMLVELHLQDCGVSLDDLQSVIDAAPRLSRLHLAFTWFSSETNYSEEEQAVVVVRYLLMPAVRALVLEDCIHQYNGSCLELDVPSLKYFRYKGHVDDTNRLSVKSHASTTHVDLHFGIRRNGNGGPTPTRELLWRFLQYFNSTKLLKLRMDFFTMDRFALEDEAIRDELLGPGGLSLGLVEQLELEAEYNIETSMMMLADLLHCCPIVRDLHMKLTKSNQGPWRSESSIDKEAGVHFDKSVSAFRNRRRRRPIVSLAALNDGNYEALDIPGLTGENSFSCLQSHLKTVSLQFFMDEPNCLGVQLAKFFAQNAMVLQELHIDDGCQEMLEHANFVVRRWIANTEIANNQLTVKE